MFNSLNKASYLGRLVNLTKRLNVRNFRTTVLNRGGGHHHEAPKGGFFRRFVPAEHPNHHQGYFYRELGNLQGAENVAVSTIAITFAWFYIFYNLWHAPENLFGHMEYPDTSKWTNQELGIPPDDEE